MPEVKVDALRKKDIGKVQNLDEHIRYSIIDGLQRTFCYGTALLLALKRDALIADRCISPESWEYFKPHVEQLPDPFTATRMMLQQVIRYEIFYNIDLEGLLHF